MYDLVKADVGSPLMCGKSTFFREDCGGGRAERLRPSFSSGAETQGQGECGCWPGASRKEAAPEARREEESKQLTMLALHHFYTRFGLCLTGFGGRASSCLATRALAFYRHVRFGRVSGCCGTGTHASGTSMDCHSLGPGHRFSAVLALQPKKKRFRCFQNTMWAAPSLHAVQACPRMSALRRVPRSDPLILSVHWNRDGVCIVGPPGPRDGAKGERA